MPRALFIRRLSCFQSTSSTSSRKKLKKNWKYSIAEKGTKESQTRPVSWMFFCQISKKPVKKIIFEPLMEKYNTQWRQFYYQLDFWKWYDWLISEWYWRFSHIINCTELGLETSPKRKVFHWFIASWKETSRYLPGEIFFLNEHTHIYTSACQVCKWQSTEA